MGVLPVGQARTVADRLIEVGNRPAEAWPGEEQGGAAWWKDYDASLDTEVAYEEYIAAW